MSVFNENFDDEIQEYLREEEVRRILEETAKDDLYRSLGNPDWIEGNENVKRFFLTTYAEMIRDSPNYLLPKEQLRLQEIIRQLTTNAPIDVRSLFYEIRQLDKTLTRGQFTELGQRAFDKTIEKITRLAVDAVSKRNNNRTSRLFQRQVGPGNTFVKEFLGKSSRKSRYKKKCNQAIKRH